MGKVYATADWHGCEAVANKVFEYLKPEDTLYFLGDAIDRGPDGIELVQKLMNRPNTIYMMGNHEEMLDRTFISYKGQWITWDNTNINLWTYNGGRPTMNALSKLPKEEVIKIMQFIRGCPKQNIIYKSPNGHKVFLEHAGYTPYVNMHKHDPLWDRTHFYDNWTGLDDTFIVHGHTPVQYLLFDYGFKGIEDFPHDEEFFVKKRLWEEDAVCDKPTILRYCDGHKFDVDMCTIVTNRIALLDLDTFEEIYFDAEEDKND